MSLRDEIMSALCLVEMGPGFENSPSRFGWRHHADALMPLVERAVRLAAEEAAASGEASGFLGTSKIDAIVAQVLRAE